MEKILTIIMIFSLLFIKLNANTDTLTKAQVYNDFKTSIKYLSENGGSALKYTVDKADSLVNKTVRTASSAASYTFNVVKKQQLVKSIQYLFYWILSIICSILLHHKIKSYIEDYNERKLAFILIFGVVDVLLMLYNGSNFNEMLTGFFNPEFGTLKDIILYSKSL